MRKHHKRITDLAIIFNLLDTCPVGRLGTISSDGWPMIKPLNFARDGWSLYFHCALEGEKLDDIRRDNRVCFEVDLPIAYVKGKQDNPCRAEYLYRSVIIRGRAALVENRAEKIQALDCLMRKFQPGTTFSGYSDDKLDITGIVRIDIDDLSGKEDLGKDDLREQALRIVAEGGPLPVVLE
jgi:nitroimidazol reductase NimA-like FMN-containing flavoprotein (pyridoxamine 5'-phosphate oxidase superfamily)